MLPVGSLIAGYRVQRVLGQGGMGAVYLVANPELPRREALKLLSAELSRDKGFRARFLREADVASRLDHPNVVSIHRRGETDDGQPWIAMQFVDGIDADQALRNNKMTPDRAVHIAGEVAKALDYAHRHNVLHRDIKPANFLLSGPVGPDERVLLGDFGIARAFDDASLTGTGQVMATVSYAAPEVVSGETVDRRADQYSLACSLFRMLTGKTPFADAGSQAQVMMAHLKKPPPRVTEQASWLPPALDGVLATAMAKDPNQRFATCADFAAAAKAALRQPSPDAEQTLRLAPRPPRPQPAPPPVHRPAGPPPQQYLPPARPAPPVHQTPPVPPPAAPPAPEPRSHRTKIIAAVAGVVVIAAAAITAIAWPSGDSGTAPAITSTVAANTTTSPAAKTTTSTTKTAAAPPAIVAAADLPGLLLSADEVGGIMGASLQADPIRDTMWDDRDGTSDKDCISAWMPAQAATYGGSGWTDTRSQVVKQPGVSHDSISVAQAVIAFPDQDKARPTTLSVPGSWQACAGRAFTVNTANGPQPWTFDQEGMPAPGLYTMNITKDSGTNRCQRGLTLRGNVIIDVLACSPGLANQAVDVVNKIAAKVPQ